MNPYCFALTEARLSQCLGTRGEVPTRSGRQTLVCTSEKTWHIWEWNGDRLVKICQVLTTQCKDKCENIALAFVLTHGTSFGPHKFAQELETEVFLAYAELAQERNLLTGAAEDTLGAFRRGRRPCWLQGFHAEDLYSEEVIEPTPAKEIKECVEVYVAKTQNSNSQP